ncbi:MAG: indolepyruvate oxidoreductase subunit beta [Rikenellaceae bacterium]
MKKDIILSGVGGQGILSIATVIGLSAMEEGLTLKQAEVHGMSQRGGDVQSNLRLSDEPIYSDLIAKGTADLIISLEPMEALRYVSYLGEDGWIITSSKNFINIPNYPDAEAIREELASIKNVVVLDVEQIAKDEVGNLRCSNMVLLGAAVFKLGLHADSVYKAVKTIFSRKGDAIIEMNIKALEAGMKAAESQVNLK